jgi:hypothetical protein
MISKFARQNNGEMEPSPTNNENNEQLLATQKKQIEALEQSFAAVEQRAKKYEDEWSALYDQNKELREENHRLQRDYETLRVQKGGFGFKMLMLSGFLGFLSGLLLCFVYVKLRPKEPHVVAFRQFQRENLINYELALSKGQFDEVERSLQGNLERPDFQAIGAEIEFMHKIVGAAKKKCGTNGGQ